MKRRRKTNLGWKRRRRMNDLEKEIEKERKKDSFLYFSLNGEKKEILEKSKKWY